jgi:hypothetical protein
VSSVKKELVIMRINEKPTKSELLKDSQIENPKK